MIAMKLEGVDSTIKALKDFRIGVQRRVIKSAATAGSAKQLTEMRRQARTLRKTKGAGVAHPQSMAKRVKQFKGTVWAGVGPRPKWSKTRTYTSIFTPKTGNDRRRKVITKTLNVEPAVFDHIVQYGARIVRGGSLSKALSRAGFNRLGQRRTTTRLSAQGRRIAGQLRRRGWRKNAASKAAFRKDTRAGTGRVVGHWEGVPYMKTAGWKSRDASLKAFQKKAAERVAKEIIKAANAQKAKL